MVNTMKQSDYVYIVYSALFTEFPEHSSTGHPTVCASKEEAYDVFDKVCDVQEAEILFDRHLGDYRHIKIKSSNCKILEVKLVKCPVLFDAYQYGNIE